MFRKIKRYWANLTHPVIGEVWQLHRVTNCHSVTALQQTYEITPIRLENLIKDYLHKRYTFISMGDLKNVIAGNLKLNKKFVSVTLDDGYRDNYEVAYPIFKKYNVPFCIYLLQNEVSGDVSVKYPMLTKEQLIELDNEPLCTLGSHTYSHPRLCDLSKDAQYDEIIRCKHWMEQLLGHSVVDFSYPYGLFNNDTIDILKQIGVEQCPMAWGGKVRRGIADVFLIPRLLVTENYIQ